MQLGENNDGWNDKNVFLLFEDEHKDKSVYTKEKIGNTNPGPEIHKCEVSLDEIEKEFCFDNVNVDIIEEYNEEEHMTDVINDELRSASMGSLDDIH